MSPVHTAWVLDGLTTVISIAIVIVIVIEWQHFDEGDTTPNATLDVKPDTEMAETQLVECFPITCPRPPPIVPGILCGTSGSLRVSHFQYFKDSLAPNQQFER